MAIESPGVMAGIAALYRARLDAFSANDSEAYNDLLFFCRKAMDCLYPDFLNDPDHPDAFPTEDLQEHAEEALGDATCPTQS